MSFRFMIIVLICWTKLKALATLRNCTNLQFECDNGECIPKENWCGDRYSLNYYKACRDGSSDRNCYSYYPRCGGNRSWCEDNKKCIPDKWICDGYRDCKDSSDEQECVGNGFRIKDMEGIKDKRKRAESWLFKSIRPNWGWGDDTDRVIAVLYLSNPGTVSPENETSGLLVKQLQIQLFDMILRNSSSYFPTHKMALYVHALLAICCDPSNFHGYDLIEELENRFQNSENVNPFVALVLCNADSEVPLERSQELANVTKEPNNSKWIDAKALALLAMVCMKNRVQLNKKFPTDCSSSIDNITRTFKSLQKDDGSFGNIYTTALVTQALIVADGYNSEWDIKKVLQYFANNERNGSFGDIISTYLILPLLHGKTLLDLGTVNCSSNFSETQSYSVKEMLDSRHTMKKSIEYNIWLEDDKKISFGMTMKVPETATFYEVMCLAGELDHRYKFGYDKELSDVYLIFGTANDPEARRYWQLFNITENATELVDASPEEFVPQDGDHYAYWYTFVDNC